MRTALAIIGVLALLVAVAVVVLFVIGIQRRAPLAKEAIAYVDDAVPAIATNWDGAALYERAAPEFRQVLTEAKLDEITSAGASLFGPMTNYGGAKCEITRVEYATGSGEQAVAACGAEASFARTKAKIATSAVKRGGEWRLFAFYVDPVGEPAAIARTAHSGAAKKAGDLTVIEASFREGYVAISAKGEPRFGAQVGDARTLHVEPVP